MTQHEKTQLSALLKIWSAEIHATSRSKGWWDDRDKLSLTKAGQVQVDLGCTMLAVSELGEMVESIRKPRKDDHLPQFSNVEVEAADCIIRLLDWSHARGLRTVDALLAKAEYNKGRTARHGGKLA